MESKEFTCIRCPIGCNITVTMDGTEVLDIKGNNCHRGEEYVRKEVSEPTRMVTSTIKVLNGRLTRVPCRTKKDVPKEKIFEVLESIKDVAVEAPVEVGDILVENVAGTGIDVIATKTIEKVYYKQDKV